MCKFCGTEFTRKDTLKRHLESRCKVKKEKEEESNKQNEFLVAQVMELKKAFESRTKDIEEIKKNDELGTLNLNTISEKFINIIIDKEKQIDELENTKKDNDIITFKNKQEMENIPINLILNNQIIVCRETDNYINATQLCKAGKKKFNDWYRLDATKEIIKQLEENINNSNTGFPALEIKLEKTELIDSKIGGDHSGTWIHPDLAIQLSQWISPKFALQVSSWIRTLFSKGSVNINLNLIKEKEKRIKILENLTLKKQKRDNYKEKNVIYLLTTKENKKNRTYIFGKATNLTNRLSTYNKTCEHEVIYYKECKDKDHIELVERMVLNKLNIYKEKANRDRFILPTDKDINFFKNTIDNCVNF